MADAIDYLNAGIKNLRVIANDPEGAVHILFDYDPASWIIQLNDGLGQPPIQILVRLFDQNGQYITHFTTQAAFLPAEFDDLWDRLDSRWQKLRGPTPRTLLAATGNHLIYVVNARDLSFARMAEVGFDGRRGFISLERESGAKSNARELQAEVARFPIDIVTILDRYLRTFDQPRFETEQAEAERAEAAQALLSAGRSAYSPIVRAATGGQGGMAGLSVQDAVATSELAIWIGNSLIPDLETVAATGQLPWGNKDQDEVGSAVRRVMAAGILARLGHDRDANVERIKKTHAEAGRLNLFNQVLLETAVGGALILTGTQKEEGIQILKGIQAIPSAMGDNHIPHRKKSASHILRILTAGDGTAP